MKKGQKAICAALIAVLTAGSAISLMACQTPLTDEPLKGTTIADYTKTEDERKETFASGSKGYSWENGEPFNVWWKPELVTYENKKMSLGLAEMTVKEQKWDAETGTNVDVVADYYGAEARTEHYYGFGDFEVRMKPAKVTGTASTFFTCTGPYDVWYEDDGETVKKTNHHDEIDIEFLGKDTTKVQFNYFANGVGGHEYMHDLGFDASLEFHDYGFRWTDSYITWFVDGEPVYRVDRANIKKGESWPEDPGRMIMNYWCGTENAQGWMGEFKNDYTGKAEYEWVKSSAAQQPDPNTAHVKEPEPVVVDVPTEGWTAISTAGFDGWSNYTVEKAENGDVTLSHTAVLGNYACCGTPLAQSYSWVKFKVKNNDTANSATMRIDLKYEKGANAVESVVSEHEGATLNTIDSAVSLVLGAGETAEVAVKIKDDAFIDQMVVFLNSISDKPATGSITISELQGIADGEVVPPAPPADSKVKIGDNEVSFTGSYNVAASEDKASMIIEYADVSGNGYSNIETSIESFVADNNAFTVTIKNEGTETVKIRMDIGCNAEDGSAKTEGGSKNEKNPFCNISATYEGETIANGNDYDWGGGDWVQIGADKTVTVKITFTANVAKKIVFFIDSSTWDDETKHSGKVVFSNMSLSKVEVQEPVTPPEPPEPPEPPVPADESKVKIGDSEVTFAGDTNDYAITASEDGSAMTVEYTGVSGKSYKNINTSIGSFVADNNAFSVTIKNEGTATVKIRMDIGCNAEDGSTKADGGKNPFCNISAEYTGTTAEKGNDYLYGGGDWVQIAAGETVTVKIVFTANVAKDVKFYMDSSTWDDETTHSGKVVFSNMSLSKVEVQEPVTPPEPPEPPEPPVTEGMSLTFSSAAPYVVDKSGEAASTINVTYADVEGATYSNISANAVDLAKDKDTFSVKVTNNGQKAVKIRIDLIGEQKVTVGDNNNMECCNISADSSKDVGIYTDTTWGGTTFTVAAGDTVVITITYSNNNGMGAVQRVQLYMDSFTEADRPSQDDPDNKVHYTDGNVTFSEFNFTKTETETPTTPPEESNGEESNGEE